MRLTGPGGGESAAVSSPRVTPCRTEVVLLIRVGGLWRAKSAGPFHAPFVVVEGEPVHRYDLDAAVLVSAVTPSRGKVGDQVTITGSGFAKGATVQFRDTAASTVTVNSATEITATVPIRLPVPKTVDVTVTVGVATSPTGPPDEFTYGG